MDEHGEIILYQTEDGLTKIDVRFEDETVWLTQQQMAELFGHSEQLPPTARSCISLST